MTSIAPEWSQPALTTLKLLADMIYKFINTVYVPDYYGPSEAERLWCYRVEVRETQSNMAFREGHREWNEDLIG